MGVRPMDGPSRRLTGGMVNPYHFLMQYALLIIHLEAISTFNLHVHSLYTSICYNCTYHYSPAIKFLITLLSQIISFDRGAIAIPRTPCLSRRSSGVTALLSIWEQLEPREARVDTDLVLGSTTLGACRESLDNQRVVILGFVLTSLASVLIWHCHDGPRQEPLVCA